MVDLAQLQSVIASAPASGAAAQVTRQFLEQVEREIRAGREALAAQKRKN